MAGHVGERAPRSAEEVPDDKLQEPVPGALGEQEEFQEVEPASSSDDESTAEGLSRRSSQSVPLPSINAAPGSGGPADPDGSTRDLPGDPGPPQGPSSAKSGEGLSGSAAGPRGKKGEGRGGAGNLERSLGDAGAATWGEENEGNGAASSALEAFLEGGLDALASRRPAIKASSFQRYNLEVAVPSGRDASAEEDGEDANRTLGAAGGAGPRPKHLSAKQRKLLKQVS